MGGGGSTLRKPSAPVVQRQPFETHQSYKARVKFQGEKLNKAPWYNKLSETFGSDSIPAKHAVEVFHSKFNINLAEDALKELYGMSEANLNLAQVAQIYADISYNPSIGAIYSALLKDREQMSEQIWREFLVDFQGHSETQLAEVESDLQRFGNFKHYPKSAMSFFHFLLGPGNRAFHPVLDSLQRFDRPLSEYFVCVSKISDVNDCNSASQVVEKIARTIKDGARVLEVHCTGGASDGEPRCCSEFYGETISPDNLPTLAQCLKAMNNAIEETYSPARQRNTQCVATGAEIQCMPLIVVLTVGPNCSAEEQRKAAAQFKEVFGSKLQVPAKNADGTIWSPLQLDSKVLLVAPRMTFLQESQVQAGMKSADVSEHIIALSHMQMVTVYEIRPILDKAKSRSELRKLLQDVVLTLSPSELCAHIMELSSITDMLLVHVQTVKRKVFREKGTNLKDTGGGAEYENGIDQDMRHVVQFSELRPGDSMNFDAKFTREVVMEEVQDEVEPLRGWRYGAQMVPVDFWVRTEASMQNMSLFKQQNNHGFVSRLPRTMLNGLPGFVDLYADFPSEYARSLFVTILSGSKIPRPMGTTQPFVRIYCNNGTGLKQVAITSTVEDNGYNCIWEEDFEFKFHVNDLNAAACLIFVIYDRDKPVSSELAFSSLPLWGLQTGYRNLQLFHMDGSEIEDSQFLLHFDWETEE